MKSSNIISWIVKPGKNQSKVNNATGFHLFSYPNENYTLPAHPDKLMLELNVIYT